MFGIVKRIKLAKSENSIPAQAMALQLGLVTEGIHEKLAGQIAWMFTPEQWKIVLNETVQLDAASMRSAHLFWALNMFRNTLPSEAMVPEEDREVYLEVYTQVTKALEVVMKDALEHIEVTGAADLHATIKKLTAIFNLRQ
ncbi:MAG: hypothetical protein K0A92_08395 [Methyloprofundus sp.]|nr:hypothetical protein [Methyloprofundus sp.]